MMRLASTHSSLPGQLELTFEPRTTEGQIAHLKGLERQLAKAILDNRWWLKKVLDDMGDGRVQGHVSPEVLRWNKDDLNTWIDEGRYAQIAESFEQLGVSAKNNYQQGSGKFIAFVAVHAAYKKFLHENIDEYPIDTMDMARSSEQEPHHVSHLIDKYMRQVQIRVAVNGRDDAAKKQAIAILLQQYQMHPNEIIDLITLLIGKSFTKKKKEQAIQDVQAIAAQLGLEMWHETPEDAIMV